MTEQQTVPTGVIVEQMQTMGGSTRNVVLFETYNEAVEAHSAIVEATRKYNDRTNYREKFFTITAIMGPVTFDVSSISGVGVDQAAHPVHRAWAKAIGEIEHIRKEPTSHDR